MTYTNGNDAVDDGDIRNDAVMPSDTDRDGVIDRSLFTEAISFFNLDAVRTDIKEDKPNEAVPLYEGLHYTKGELRSLHAMMDAVNAHRVKHEEATESVACSLIISIRGDKFDIPWLGSRNYTIQAIGGAAYGAYMLRYPKLSMEASMTQRRWDLLTSMGRMTDFDGNEMDAEDVYRYLSQWDVPESMVPERIPFIHAFKHCLLSASVDGIPNGFDLMMRELISMDNAQVNAVERDYWITMWMTIFNIRGLRFITLLSRMGGKPDITDDDIMNARSIIMESGGVPKLIDMMVSLYEEQLHHPDHGMVLLHVLVKYVEACIHMYNPEPDVDNGVVCVVPRLVKMLPVSDAGLIRECSEIPTEALINGFMINRLA